MNPSKIVEDYIWLRSIESFKDREDDFNKILLMGGSMSRNELESIISKDKELYKAELIEIEKHYSNSCSSFVKMPIDGIERMKSFLNEMK